jgi:alpha-beta hydrolase superfamily lysophospholipase
MFIVNTMLERRTVQVPAGTAPAGVATVTARIISGRGPRPARPVVLCCFPGGGVSARYFELDGADMAAYLARRGFVVVLIDHPGTGGSDVPDDPWTLRPEVVADVDATAVGDLVADLGLVDPVLIGVGHSMGAMLVAYQQARHRCYEGVALLGHSGRGLPEVLTEEELAVAGEPDKTRLALVGLARARFGRPLVPSGSGVSAMLTGPQLPARIASSLGAAAASLLPLCGLTSMIPGSHADVLAAVDVPVLLGIAEHDIVGPPREAPAYLAGADDITLYVLAEAYHNSNVAPTRTRLWDRLAIWASAVAEALPGRSLQI